MRIQVELEVEIPDIPHTADDLEEYLSYSFGETASIPLSNPFHKLGEPDTIYGTLIWDKI
jgi:hypothetical protein